MRFGFGKNWKNYIKTLDENRINNATVSLANLLGISDLTGKSFIDIGSGSGLMSLAARRLGATVFSFDYDKDSVETTTLLKNTFRPDDQDWIIEQGSVLDETYLKSKGRFDIVYSWGVLHHTGNMWQALANVSPMVKPGGILCIAIYNNQGFTSKLWKAVKWTYNSNILGMLLVSAIFIPYFYSIGFLFDTIRHGNPFYSIQNYQSNRGMNVYHDTIDWIGGYPFEVATHEKIFIYFKNQGYQLENLTSTTSIGCNEYVFRKTA